jgi:hypothetical protein
MAVFAMVHPHLMLTLTLLARPLPNEHRLGPTSSCYNLQIYLKLGLTRHPILKLMILYQMRFQVEMLRHQLPHEKKDLVVKIYLKIHPDSLDRLSHCIKV